ncbi:MAG: aspartate aminotransferase family protein [Bacteroidia bacterium]|nr:aspartate aminotransferase family protein [Bacteroidia bacterium]
MSTQRELFLTHVAQTSPAPLALEIERAEGVYLYDSSGKRYTDLIAGISVSNVGHRHPHVLAAIHTQLDKYLHLLVYGEYVQTPQVKLAQKLATLLPHPLNSTYFVNSGAEAIDGALKLAKRLTGRSQLISFRHAYHGSTHAALSIMGSETFKTAYRPLLPDTMLLDYNDFGQLAHITTRTAAVVIEAVQGEAGAVTPAPGFLEAVRARCTETGTLLIFDEIQTGLGRTGKMFALEHSGIVPDILCLAKGLGGGLPIGVFISSQPNMQAFTEKPVLGHITTFGGNAVCCAAALAVIETIENENLLAGVAAREAIVRETLVHPLIRQIRGKGLLLAVELSDFTFTKAVIDEAISNGVITDWFLFCDNALRIAPPLNIDTEELRRCCEIILQAIEKLGNATA